MRCARSAIQTLMVKRLCGDRHRSSLTWWAAVKTAAVKMPWPIRVVVDINLGRTAILRSDAAAERYPRRQFHLRSLIAVSQSCSALSRIGLNAVALVCTTSPFPRFLGANSYILLSPCELPDMDRVGSVQRMWRRGISSWTVKVI